MYGVAASNILSQTKLVYIKLKDNPEKGGTDKLNTRVTALSINK